MLIKTPDLIEAMIELACSRRWLQTTIYVIDFSQHVLHGLWLKDSSLLQVCPPYRSSYFYSIALELYVVSKSGDYLVKAYRVVRRGHVSHFCVAWFASPRGFM